MMAKRKNTSYLDMELLGKRITEKRKSRGLAQEMLATRLGCSVSYISKLECGAATCNVHRLAEMATIFGCDLAELLCGLESGGRVVERELADRYGRMNGDGQRMALQMMDVILQQRQFCRGEGAAPQQERQNKNAHRQCGGKEEQ